MMLSKIRNATAALLCHAACLAQSNVNPPFVIPALREWHGAEGNFILQDKVTLTLDPAYSDKLTSVARTFSEDLKAMRRGLQCSIRNGAPSNGDIYFTLHPDDSARRKEGYGLEIGNKITIDARESIGAFWATRTLLQLLEQDKAHRLIPKGKAVDYPQFAVRGFVLDCARKFFTMEYLRNYVKFMSYYKMNDFHIHLNDNAFSGFYNNNWDSTYAAFRLECAAYPNLTAKDGSYGKKEFMELQELGKSYGVIIVPEIDVPAHSLAFTRIVPEIGSKVYGMDHLDLDNPLTYAVLDNIFKEYLEGPAPVFIGKEVHIGTDEYAKKEAEKFRAFTDRYIRYAESFGKKVRLWGALTHAQGNTPVKSENVTMNFWYNGYADPKEMTRLGYDGISTPDGWLYIVPAAGYYNDYLNTKKIYEEWTPNKVGKEIFSEDDPKIRGGSFAVWNDHAGNGITQHDVHHRVFPAMQTLAQKMWGGKNLPTPYETFVEKSKGVGEGPGLNMLGRFGNKDSLVWQYDFKNKKILKSKSIVSQNNVIVNGAGQALQLNGGKSFVETPYRGIGYNYTVCFSINPHEGNARDAVIFSSTDATVKLKQQGTGKLGFSREGYAVCFNYEVPVKQWTRLAIVGDNQGTTLYVNGVLKEKLAGAKRTFANGKQMAKVQTLFFPLQFIGDKENAFKGLLKNIKAYNYILSEGEIAMVND